MEEEIEKEQLLRRLYYGDEDIGLKTAYRSPQHLWELAREENPSLEMSKHYVKQWLLKQASYTRWNRPKHFRHTFVRDFNQIQIDLVVMLKHPEENEGYKYILSAIEILSRFAFVVPLKSKNAKDTAFGVESILEKFRKRFHYDPTFIQFDEGKEFDNKEVKAILSRLGITGFSTNSPRKASVVERLNRTLKSKMMRMFQAHGDNNWVEFIDDLVENYNTTPHRVIKMKPIDVNEKNKFEIWMRLFGHLVTIQKPKFKIGDKVRILKLDILHHRAQLKRGEDYHYKIREESKKTFGDFFRDKYKNNDPEKVVYQQAHNIDVNKRPPFSTEIFTIDKVWLGDPNVYKLKSIEFDRIVLGIFYEEELSLVKD